MKSRIYVPGRLLIACFLFFVVFSLSRATQVIARVDGTANQARMISAVPIRATEAIEANSPVIDGIIDQAYGDPVASDPVDPPQGNANLDMGDLFIIADANNFYFAYTIHADIGATNWGKYLMYIDTTNDSNGATSDAWGRNVVVNNPHKPEFSLNTYVDSTPYGPEDTQLWAWNQGTTSWSQVGAADAAALATGSISVIEWQIARSALGNPETIWVEVWSTGGGADPAQDTINNPADDWNATDWTTTAVLANSTQFGAPVVDGVIDQSYGQPIASDPVDPPQGNANLDMGSLYLAEDADSFYFAYTVNADIAATNWGKYLMYIDTTNDSNGATSDAWGRNVVVNDPHKPEYSLNTYVDSAPYGPEDTQLWAWNQGTTSWSQVGAADAAASTAGATSVIEWQVSKAALGNPNTMWVEVWSTGGGADPAQDTINNPADDWNATDWTTTAVLANSTQFGAPVVDGVIDQSYGQPIASDPVDPPQGNANLDMGSLYAADDADNFYFAYTVNADIGATNWGKYLMYIDTTRDANGATSDAWGRNVVVNDPHKPEYSLNTYVDSAPYGPEDTQLWVWNQGTTSWSQIGGADDAASTTGATSVIEWQVSKAALGNPDTIYLEVWSTGGGPDPAQDTVNNPADDWNATDWSTTAVLANSTQYKQQSTPPTGGGGGCASGAAPDNDIWWGDLGHDSRDGLYRTPGGAVETGTAVTLRFRSACDDLTQARVRVWNDRINVQTIYNLTKVASDSTHDWWEVTLPVSPDPTIYWYRFMALDGTATAYYEDDGARTGGWGQTFGSSPDNGWQLTIYDPAFQTPDWVKNGIMYQIFADRFRNGNSANDTPVGSFFYADPRGTIYRSNETAWNTAVCDPRDNSDPNCYSTYSQNFYGGDLQGIIDQLDYLEDLGVTVLYLNPIFESPSNHKYDTTDYSIIDDNFGTLANFQTLATEAQNRGMSIVLDGVFNHTSSDSIYFDRYVRYPAPDGACESMASPYRPWFFFQPASPPGTGVCAGDTNYTSWFGFDSLPKLDSANQAVRDLIWASGPNAIARYWITEGADGWRLDVGGDVDPGTTNDPNNNYWEGFRTAVHTANPDGYIVGEEWNVATAWTVGGEWDATMNYQFSSAILSFWRDTSFIDNDHNAGSSAGILTPLTPSQLNERLLNLQERYPGEAFYAMMNLLGSHDTNRALFMLDENTGSNDDTIYQNPNYDWSPAIAKLKGVVLLQMTLPGAPTIYYGDEVGLVGPVTYDGSTWQDDPYNRQPFPWLDETGLPFYTSLQSQNNQDSLRDYYTTLTTARNSHPALRTGSFDPLLVDNTNQIYAYGRLMDDYSDAAVVILNRAGTVASPITQTVTLDVSGYLPTGATFDEVLSGDSYTVNGNGELVVDVPGESGAVLVLTSTLPQPPAAVADLAVTDVRSEELDLGWTAVLSATSYDIYRSLVSGGGYSLIDNMAGTSYTDSNLTNATTYYYVVVARNDSTGLVSDDSNEVVGIPQHDLSAAWYNLQSPATITHTISTITPTANIYGQLYIAGETGPLGPATGIHAQIGYAVSGTLPITSTGWAWVEMNYFGIVGNNDEYAGNLLPDTLGDFQYATRYSSDGGNTWYYADLDGPGYSPEQAGVLQVVASSDTTAPNAPANLTLDGTSSSSILFSWDANGEPDLAGYEIYRQETAPFVFERIASVAAGVTSFVDDTVTTGATYDYYVVAFDTSFNRSGASNIITAVAEPRYVTVTFRVGVPDYTPGTVYIVGDIPEFGPWNPGLVPMTQIDATTWEYSLNILDGTQMQYKYTRGTWDTVESWGSIVVFANRTLTIDYGTDGTQLVDNTATDWGNGPDDEKAVRYWRDPIVVDFSPAAAATNVPTDTQVIVTWSLTMTADTDFTVIGPVGVVTGTFANADPAHTTTFTPNLLLMDGATYTVTVAGEGSVGVPGGDTGVQQVPVTWQFTTLEPAGPTANVQIAHLASFAPQAGSAVTVTLDSTPILTNFAFLDSTTYLTIPVGTHEVGIVPAGSNTPVVTETVSLFADTDYTILATGDGTNQPLDLLMLTDDNSPTIPGFTRLRAGHLAPFATGSATVDVRLQDGTPVFVNLAYGQTSSYVTLPAGVYDLKVTTPGGGTTLVDPLPVTMTAGDIGSAFMIGDVANNPLGVYGIFNGEEGALLPQTPLADFVSNSPVMVGGTAVFTNTTTPGYWPVSYEWDLGDGTITTDTNPSHVYATPGVYEVILTAENQFATNVYTGSFTVNTIPLVAGFSSNSPIELGSLAVFTNTTTGGGPISYEWDFGDNSAVVTATNPIHTYAMTGTYMVVLTATNGFDTAVVTGTYTVLEVPTTVYALYLPLVAKPEATQSAPIAFPGGVRRR